MSLRSERVHHSRNLGEGGPDFAGLLVCCKNGYGTSAHNHTRGFQSLPGDILPSRTWPRSVPQFIRNFSWPCNILMSFTLSSGVFVMPKRFTKNGQVVALIARVSSATPPT